MSDADVLIETAGSLGRIRLNRPKALNSLTLDMGRRISRALDAFEQDRGVAAVLLTGEGERGLCAGGDIRALYDSGRAGDGMAATFWREEYILNARISRFAKPYIAVMDGLTMGGGVGLSAHGSHRLVTERTRLAMPETGIGFLPDVGGTWLLSHAPGEVGTYLGLVGEAMGAADAIYAGLADLCVPTARLPALVEALKLLPVPADGSCVRQAIAPFAVDPGSSTLEEERAAIDRAFAADDVATILAALAGLAGARAGKARAALLANSPTSLKLTLRLLRLGRTSVSLERCLEREYAAALHVLAGHDFYEGIRAAVIDKDRTPRWSPPRLDDVRDSDIDAYLTAVTEPVFSIRADKGPAGKEPAETGGRTTP
jgi:enoyl-CoA hydratase